jgi:hypothetical protein
MKPRFSWFAAGYCGACYLVGFAVASADCTPAQLAALVPAAAQVVSDVARGVCLAVDTPEQCLQRCGAELARRRAGAGGAGGAAPGAGGR